MTGTTRVARTAQAPGLDLFRLYLDQIGRHRLLTAEDEVEPTRPAWRPGASSPTPTPATPPARRRQPRPVRPGPARRRPAGGPCVAAGSHQVRAVGSFDPQRPDADYTTGGSLAQWFDVIVQRRTVTPWRPL